MNTGVDLDTVVRQTLKELLFKGFDFNVYYVENAEDHIYAMIIHALIREKLSFVGFLGAPRMF